MFQCILKCMIRMIEENDIFACWWWYNWYITHSYATFETEPVSSGEFTERVHAVREKYPWIILEEDGVPVGYAYLSAFNVKAAYRWTCDLAIYLAPDKLGRGYGSQLMKAILDLAEKDGYYNMVSLITCGNTESERLHVKFGFEKMGVIESAGIKNGQNLSVAFYQKTIRKFEGGEIPAEPVNLDPYKEERKGRVPFF